MRKFEVEGFSNSWVRAIGLASLGGVPANMKGYLCKLEDPRFILYTIKITAVDTRAPASRCRVTKTMFWWASIEGPIS